MSAGLVIGFFSSLLASASDCSMSSEFEVKHPQVLRGVLLDRDGLALSGSGIELLSRKQVVQRVRADRQGVYDFGEIPSGRYRIHVNAYAFCAPKVVCKAGTCSFKPRVKLNSKNLVTVY